MKLLFCNTCGDIVKLGKTTRTCQCGSCGGHYREDGVHAIYYGPAVPIGIINSEFVEAVDNQSEFGDGVGFGAFTIPKVCPTMDHVDYLDYFPVDGEEVDLYDDLMEEAEVQKKQKKLKNVFKDEE